MQIIGIGTEIVECLRIAQMIDRHRELFLSRVFTEQEMTDCRTRRKATEHFAARFAAKIAVWKCLAPDSRRTIHWSEIEIVHPPGDRPKVKLHGVVNDLAARRQVREIWLSYSHSRMYAVAYALAVTEEHEA